MPENQVTDFPVNTGIILFCFREITQNAQFLVLVFLSDCGQDFPDYNFINPTILPKMSGLLVPILKEFPIDTGLETPDIRLLLCASIS